MFTQARMATKLWRRRGFPPFRRSGSLEREKPPGGIWGAFLLHSTFELVGRCLWDLELGDHFIYPEARASEKANEQHPDAIA